MISEKAKDWIRRRKVSRTARDVGVIPRTGFAWIKGVRTPRPKDAAALICLARSEGVELAYDDIYGPPEQVARKGEQ